MSYLLPTLFPPQFEDANGNPLVLGTIEFYVWNTTTPSPFYTDSIGTSGGVSCALGLIGQPINGGGTSIQIFLDSAITYKVVRKDAAGTVIAPTLGPYSVSQASQIEGELISAFFISKALRVVDSIAALKALSKTQYTRSFVTGYYAAGDGGGGPYWYDSTDTTSTDNGGTIIVASDGGRWKLQQTTPISLKQFGAKGDLSQNDTPYIQACVTWAAGRLIYAPAGQYKMVTGVTSTDQINLYGDGNGCGPGAASIDNSNITQFMLYGNIFAFQSTTVYPSTFRDFQINVAVANRPQATGGGIRLIGSGSATLANSKIYNVGFSNVILPISANKPVQMEVTGCYFDTWITAAIYMDTTAGIEGGGGYIHHNFFFGDTSAANTQGPCIFSRIGYLDVHDNLLLGATYAVYASIENNAAGAIKIHDNWVEEQITNGFYFATLDHTSELNMLNIHDNEFSNITNIVGFGGHIVILEDTTNNDWISDVQIHDNVYRSQLAAAAKYVWVQAAKKLKIHNETIDDLGAANPAGIQVSGATTSAGLIAPLNVYDNQVGGTSNAYVFSATAKTVLREQNGFTVAGLPTNCADGSTVYCSDGTFANPVAGGGTGCIAKRLNGVWRGD